MAFKSEGLDDSRNQSIILSGMLLSHCLTYGSVDNKITPADESFLPKAETNIAFLAFKYSQGKQFVRSQVTYANQVKFFESNVSTLPSDGGVLWIHLTSLYALSSLITHYNLPERLIQIFYDPSTFSRCHSFDDGIGHAIQLVTEGISNGIINIKKLHIYCCSNLVITLEQSSHAVVDQPDALVDYSSVFNPVGLTRGSSLTFGSELNLNAYDLENPLVDQVDDPTQWESKFKGVLLDVLLWRLDREEIKRKLCEVGASYLIFEIIKAMLKISGPVVREHAQALLALHEKVFVRHKKPDVNETKHLLDQIDITRLSCKLLNFVLNESLSAIQRVASPSVNLLSSGHYEDLSFGYRKTIEEVTRLQQEIERIYINLKELNIRRSDRVHLMLTLVATTFLPLTFITGVFGMNFSDGGGLVYILRVKDGSYAFFVISIVSVLFLLGWFYSESFFDLLATREINRHTKDFEKQKKTLFNVLGRKTGQENSFAQSNKPKVER